ncbi:GntR family transcriptional regulator [Rhizobium sp. BK376]|uniref:GntR family transcriptional regulator n=1 Tax=Rhizobium sp. BK376 TaxID=2512149 RepID=UPI0010479E95|nr:GntR family transcriptional regulator [Rhizobium sp. BK376]TCR71445.1 DNA-binding GntR family transcriptional regulator [Rhizobium sp. BK376]
MTNIQPSLKPASGLSERAPSPDAADAESSLAGQSLHGEVLCRLRDYIIEGHLKDGARVPERELCDLFGVSRTPLREALKVLASEGFVELLPNRGARVKGLDANELRELFDVMGGFESLAGRLACENISADEINEIEQIHYEMYGYYLRRELDGYFRCNQAIHRRIVEIAGNKILTATYFSFGNRIRRVRYIANLDQHHDRWSEAMREHEAILDALRRKAGRELSDILFNHLRNKRYAVFEHLGFSNSAE